MLKKPLIASEIARLTAKISKKSELTAERVMEELSTIALFDPATMYDENGKLLRIIDMPEETRRAIAGIEEDLVKGTKLRISSKLGSLELVSKIIGMVRQQEAASAAVQIIIGAPPSVAAPAVEQGKLLPEWD
jgi:phage terminase small subunit